MTSEEIYLVAFATVPGIGSARLKLLLGYFGSVESAWKASKAELQMVGLPKDALFQLSEQRKKISVQQYCENLEKRDIKVITIFNESYPERLKNIPDPPNILFIKSKLSTDEICQLSKSKIIGIVGTRKITHYGQEITAKLTADLVAAGFTIVSGLALGVDGVAHGTTINSGGKTIAVLGAGVEIIYPPAHKDLYNSIVEHDGVILSEVAPEKTVIKGIFPARNRIISGLSEATLVTEGAIDSGSLITARAALEQGREVFAVPGQINSPMAQGTNYLLKQGAKLVTDVSDILETLGYEKTVTQLSSNPIKNFKGDTADEQTIIDLLVNEPLEFDELIKKTGFSSGQLNSILALMEIKGILKTFGLQYRLI